MAGPLLIESDGPKVVSTNYWSSDLNKAGVLYLSVNAGCFRLLIPSGWESDILFGTYGVPMVVVSLGPWQARNASERQVGPDGEPTYELLFDDGTDDPYTFHLGLSSADRKVPAEEHGKAVSVALYVVRRGKPHCARTYPARFRASGRIPDQRRWSDAP